MTPKWECGRTDWVRPVAPQIPLSTIHTQYGRTQPTRHLSVYYGFTSLADSIVHVQSELAPIQPSLSSEYPPREVESDVGAGKGDKTTLFLLEPTTWALAPWIRSPPSGLTIGHFLAATYTTRSAAFRDAQLAVVVSILQPALQRPRGFRCQIICEASMEWLKPFTWRES